MSGVARMGRDLLLGPATGHRPVAGRTADVAADLAADSGLLDRLSAAEADLLDGPHILVCTDEATGLTTYAGPYPTGYDAVACLADHEAGQQPHPGVRAVTCTVAPLLRG